MNREQVVALIRQTFTHAFDKTAFPQLYVKPAQPVLMSPRHSRVTVSISRTPSRIMSNRYERLGTYTSPDNEKLDVLIVYLTTESKLERARTAIRNFVADHLKTRDEKDAALVAFVSPIGGHVAILLRQDGIRYRGKGFRQDRCGNQLTPARRFSYIVGEGESCHTAQTRFLELLQDTDNDPSLRDIEEAFSVEAVTKEFFSQYAALFGDIQAALEKLVAKDQIIRKEFKAKNVSTVDFAKKLMGQIVFLYFLQKKGWLGVAKGQDWGTGPHDFLRRLARRDHGYYDNFFNDVLEPLFYDTLATDRGHEAWCNHFKCRIPFLNGGLFEPLGNYDWRKADIILPNKLFTNTERTDEGDIGTGVLDVFDRYNFTVNEAEPLEKEVAIDPEMLGKVFENLIEENRRKGLGSYYTPREIVHYMCQEGLINYLDTTVNKDKEAAPRADLETFVHLGDQISHYEAVETRYAIKMPKSIEQHARLIDEKLADITICDPAVGSGAFPVGMMTEIVRARSALTPYFNDVHDRTPYHFKRHAIQNCLYGVDIDPGAVEIAKLRLWLSLVVDEEDVKQIKPLPNLFYKIVTGNSLLGVEKNLFNQQLFRRLEELKPCYFDETDKYKKDRYKQQIDDTIHELTKGKEGFDFEIYFSEVFHHKKGFDVCLGNPPYGVDLPPANEKEFVTRHPVVKKVPDSYCCFMLQCFALLRKNGVVSLIVPNTFCDLENGELFRRHLLESTELIWIWQSGWAFEAAVVDTLVFLAKNTKPKFDSAIRITVNGQTYSRQISDFLSSKLAKIDYRNPPGRGDLLRKIQTSSTELGSIAEVKAGVKMYEKGKGQPQQTTKTVKERPYSVVGKCPSGWKALYRGTDVGRYLLRPPSEFVNYGPWLAAPRNHELFTSPKILMRRTDDRLRSCLETKSAICVNSCHVIKLKPQIVSKMSYEFLLGILNARLTQYFFEVSNPQMVGKVFAEIKVIYVERLPIPTPSPEKQKSVERLVDRILAAKRREAEADVSALEREIDVLVYALYGLTKEEIALVEAAAK